MATIAQVRKLAASLAATVDEHEFEIYVDAPRGQEWACDGVHVLSCQIASTMREPALKRQALDYLLNRMQQGLSPCTSQCDHDDN